MSKCKECTKCGQRKPLFAFSKDKRTKDGYRYVCKSCDRQVQKESRKKIVYVTKETKTCTDCGRTLPITAFGKDKTKKDGHRSYCLDCLKARSDYYNHANKHRIIKH